MSSLDAELPPPPPYPRRKVPAANPDYNPLGCLRSCSTYVYGFAFVSILVGAVRWGTYNYASPKDLYLLRLSAMSAAWEFKLGSGEGYPTGGEIQHDAPMADLPRPNIVIRYDFLYYVFKTVGYRKWELFAIIRRKGDSNRYDRLSVAEPSPAWEPAEAIPSGR